MKNFKTFFKHLYLTVIFMLTIDLYTGIPWEEYEHIADGDYDEVPLHTLNRPTTLGVWPKQDPTTGQTTEQY